MANSLINGRKEQALDILRRTPLDNGIACESIDENTGNVLLERILQPVQVF